MDSIKVVKIKKLPNFYALPEYAHETDSGMDLYATEDFLLRPFRKIIMPTGIAVQLQKNWEFQIRPRSGLASKGIMVLNSPGTIDSGYTGEVKVILGYIDFATAEEPDRGIQPLKFLRGQRIAQLVLHPVFRVLWHEVNEFEETDRGSAGFGSTDVQKA